MDDDGLLADSPQRWAASEEGVLRQPPDDHVLDHLVRVEVLSRSDDFLFLPEYLARYSGPGTVAVVESLPPCDICSRRERRPRSARYDGALVAMDTQPWAFMCSLCFLEQGPPELGTGSGQYLMERAEVSPVIWRRFRRAEQIWTARLPS
jgi:hypothetical protein